jgi:hypothetical protein
MMITTERPTKTTGLLVASWAVGGFTLIIASAVLRLLPHAFDAIRTGLSALQWIILILWSLFMLFSEGYRGFQKQFSPRFATRLQYLLNKPGRYDLILAPFYCMCYFHAPKKRVITSWSLTLGIVLLVIIVRLFPQPWRGIIDVGVVLGLLYGLIWVYILTLRVVDGKANYITS